MGRHWPVCYNQYTWDGVREHTATETAIMATDLWWIEECNGGKNPCEGSTPWWNVLK